jgi:staphylococcal nuclease domain-containing protein 1
VGNIAEHLVAAGLARVVDWHAGMLASGGGMERLRAAEKAAKEKRAYLYANTAAPSSKSNGSAPAGSSRNFDATVVRVWSGDQISVVDKDGKERRLQLSSTRAPKYKRLRGVCHSTLIFPSTDRQIRSKLFIHRKLESIYEKNLSANT